MKTIVKKLSLLGFIMMSSYTFTKNSMVNVKVKLPNDTFTFVESKKGKHEILLVGPGEHSFKLLNPETEKTSYTLAGYMDNNKVYTNLQIITFKDHHDWLWEINPDGTTSLKYLNEDGQYIAK